MKIKEFIKSNYPKITKSRQFYLSVRRAQTFPRDSLNRNRAGARENPWLNGRSDGRMPFSR